jgi:hypothetical protein
MTTDFYKELNHFIPGFTMGFVRSIISHPFEMLKLKTQMNIKDNRFKNLFKGIHLSILTNSFERGIQFYYFKQINEKLNNILLSSLYSSLISTTISDVVRCCGRCRSNLPLSLHFFEAENPIIC